MYISRLRQKIFVAWSLAPPIRLLGSAHDLKLKKMLVKRSWQVIDHDLEQSSSPCGDVTIENMKDFFFFSFSRWLYENVPLAARVPLET